MQTRKSLKDIAVNTAVPKVNRTWNKSGERKKKCLVMSGGQDSTTCLFIEKARGSELIAVSYNYGQRHAIEIESAKLICKLAGIPHEVITIPDILRGGTLLGGNLDTYENYDKMVAKVGDNVEATYVPVRNLIFLTLAANYAISKGLDTLVTGVCGSDTANYPDCTKTFVSSAIGTISKAWGQPFYIDAPLIVTTKPEICKKAWFLGTQCWDALSYSHTAYSGKLGTKDHSSLLRAKGFEEAGLPDPMIVRAHKEHNFPLPKTANYTKQLVAETMAVLSDRSDYAD